MKQCIIVVLMVLLPNSCYDKPEKIVLGFYDWYLSVVGNQPSEEYEPVFKADENGMATLSMEKYIQNLRKHNCSENMINKEVLSYQECFKNIRNVRYSALLSDFDYDGVGCSFVNYNRWTHSQEPVDGVKVTEVKTLPDGKQMVKGRFYNFDKTTKEYLYWDWYCQVVLIQVNRSWKIDEISITDK